MKNLERKLVQKELNKAGYPVYERRAAVSIEEDEEEAPRKMNRRGFLGLFSGALSAGALASVPAMKILTDDRESKTQESPAHLNEELRLSDVNAEKQPEAHDLEEILNEHEGHNFEAHQVSESRHFFAEVDTYVKKYENDVHIALERALVKTEGDEKGRSRFDYLQEELIVSDIPRSIAGELQKHIIGVCNEESRFKAASKSGVGAKGFLQFMPETWDEHAERGADISSLVDQVEAAKSKFSQIYRHFMHTCSDELDAIKAEYFFGDEYMFEAQFLVPLMINAYNAGQGNMEKVVRWFVHAYPMQKNTDGLFVAGEIISGYDVFFGMTQQAYKQNAVGAYRDEASAYVPKIFAGTRTLEGNRTTADV